MRPNRWENFIGITTFGESHGVAIGVVLEDIKPGIEFPLDQIQEELDKRKPGVGKYSSQRKEKDKIEIISGVLNGVTTGLPICLLIYNHDPISKDYEDIKNIFRPGHADYTYFKKFKIYDYRGGGRSSGRETISRVAASGVINELIDPIDIKIYPIQIGNIKASEIDLGFVNEISWPDRNTFTKVIEFLDNIKKEGNSAGGIIECSISRIPAGLGDPVFEKLDANLAKGIVSIGSVKGIEFGNGFELAEKTGSEANDQISSSGFLSNSSGGILGGISSGQNIRFRFAVKPTPSIKISQSTVNSDNENIKIKLKGRFDTLIIPRIIPVARAMVKLVLADAISYQNLICGKDLALNDYREAIDKIDEDILIAIIRRMKIAESIGKYKQENNLTVNDLNREKEILENLRNKADNFGLNIELIDKIWKNLISEAKKMQ